MAGEAWSMPKRRTEHIPTRTCRCRGARLPCPRDHPGKVKRDTLLVSQHRWQIAGPRSDQSVVFAVSGHLAVPSGTTSSRSPDGGWVAAAVVAVASCRRASHPRQGSAAFCGADRRGLWAWDRVQQRFVEQNRVAWVWCAVLRSDHVARAARTGNPGHYFNEPVA